MKKERKDMAPLYNRIREILESARSSVARSVNTTQSGGELDDWAGDCGGGAEG